jgi:hypothetical protein
MEDIMKPLILILAILTLAACSAVDPAPTGPRVELLTPIPGVSTAERLSAAKQCADGMLLGGLSAAPIMKATDETVGGMDAKKQAEEAAKALLEAKQKGIGQGILDACTKSLGYAEQARAIRAGRAPVPAAK